MNGPEATAERALMNHKLLIALAQALSANEKTQRRFRTVVLIRLSKIETLLTDVLGAQLAQYWPPGSVPNEKRDQLVLEVDQRISRASDELGLKMVRYIYGESDEPEVPRDRRRKWSDWEI